ncbi:MAG: hypothetical protein AAGK21_13460 [Bacteroidota bacterium]
MSVLLHGYVYPAGDTVCVATHNLEHFVDAFNSCISVTAASARYWRNARRPPDRWRFGTASVMRGN